MPQFTIERKNLSLFKKIDKRSKLLSQLTNKISDCANRSCDDLIVYREVFKELLDFNPFPTEKYINWVIVWEKFHGVSEEDRKSLITDALKVVYGKGDLEKTNSVVGLEPKDPLAKKLKKETNKGE